MTCDFKNGIVESCSKLFDAACLGTACWAKDVERIGGIDQPDDDISAAFVKDETRIKIRCVRRGCAVALNGYSRWFATDSLTRSSGMG